MEPESERKGNQPDVNADLPTLTAALETLARQGKKQALESISALQFAAEELGMTEIASQLGHAYQGLNNDRFKIIVVGRFKNGKSTLLNALLGKLTNRIEGLPSDQGPMKSHRLPCTAILSRVVYSDKSYVRRWNEDGTSEEWSFTRYLTDSSMKGSEEETRRFFDSIREFEVGLPVELCRPGLEMLDSPGISDMPKRTAYTKQAIRKSDAAIVVFTDQALAGQDERDFVERDIIGDGATRIFTVVNLWYPIDDELKRFAWHRLVNKPDGSATYQESDFEKNDVFFLNAKSALRSKLSNDKAGLVDSGLLALETRLGEFLSKERCQTHMNRWVRKALDSGASIPEQVSQRLVVLKSDQAEIGGRLLIAQKRLELIGSRRAKLEDIFSRYRRLITSAGRISFQDAVARISKELPEELRKEKLKSLAGWMDLAKAVLKPTPAAAEEAIKLVEEIASKKINQWAEDPDYSDGLQRAIAPHVHAMLEEVKSEVADIDTEIQRIRQDATGSLPGIEHKSKVITVTERAMSAAAGSFSEEGLDSIFNAASGSWAAVTGVLVGEVGGIALLIGLSLVGFTIGTIGVPIVLIMGMLSGLAGPAATIEASIKKAVLKRVQANLADLPEEKLRLVEQGLDKEMAHIEEGVLQEVNSAITEEQQRLVSLIKDNERSQQEKTSLATKLEEIEQRMSEQMKRLRDSLTIAQQTVG